MPFIPPTPNAVPLQADGDFQVPPPPPEKVYADAVASGNTSVLAQQAKDNFGTPIGEAATNSYGIITNAKTKLNDLIAPVEQAATPQEKNIAAASALKSVKDYPQWGTALMAMLMGQKETAFNLVTGGAPKTTPTYGKSGKQYLYTVNQLGQPLGITDRNGNEVTPEQYEADSGGINQIENTLRYKNSAKISEQNVESLTSGLRGYNAHTSVYRAQQPFIEQANEILSTLPSNLLKSTAVSTLAGMLTSGKQSETGTTASTSGMSQKTEGVTGAKSEGQTTGMGGHVGGVSPEGGVGVSPGSALPVGVNASGSVKKDTSTGTNASELSMGQTGSGSSARNANNSTSNREAYAAQLMLENIGAPEQQKLLQVWDIANGIRRGNEQLVKSGERMPSFITLPSDSMVSEGIPALKVRLKKQEMNTELLEGFNKFYQDNIGAHTKTGVPPSMQELEAAYSRTTGPGSYKEIQRKYLKQVSDILKSVPKDEPGIEVKFGPMEKKSGPVKPPETKRKSLAEILG